MNNEKVGNPSFPSFKFLSVNLCYISLNVIPSEDSLSQVYTRWNMLFSQPILAPRYTGCVKLCVQFSYRTREKERYRHDGQTDREREREERKLRLLFYLDIFDFVLKLVRVLRQLVQFSADKVVELSYIPPSPPSRDQIVHVKL